MSIVFWQDAVVTATFVIALAGAAVLVQGAPAARQVTFQESSFRPVVVQGEQEFAAEEYDRAKRTFSKVRDGARSIPGAHTDLANALNDLAEVYREWQRPADARPLLEEALAITQATSDNKLQIAVLNNSGMVFQLLREGLVSRKCLSAISTQGGTRIWSREPYLCADTR